MPLTELLHMLTGINNVYVLRYLCNKRQLNVTLQYLNFKCLPFEKDTL